MARGSLEDQFRPADVRPHRPQGLLDDEPHADRSGEVHDDVGVLDEAVEEVGVQDAPLDEGELGLALEPLHVASEAGREVVERDDVVAASDERIGRGGCR